ncbi:unnamed protein product [Calicophoron daubneyi]|uniref:Uncharacterized protein n=1 Tax=Calicophoron daubneyi TaxID=300641 RepID=A0AAV2TRD6_CALDB
MTISSVTAQPIVIKIILGNRKMKFYFFLVCVCMVVYLSAEASGEPTGRRFDYLGEADLPESYQYENVRDPFQYRRDFVLYKRGRYFTPRLGK